MKKVINILIVFVMLIPTFYKPNIIHAETLGDMKNKLNKQQEEYAQSEKQKQLTQEEINNALTLVQNSYSQLQKRANKERLLQWYETYHNLQQEEYTVESWNQYVHHLNLQFHPDKLHGHHRVFHRYKP